jgi:hypothetical protein
MKQSQPTYQRAETSNLIRLLGTKRNKKEMIRRRGGLSPIIDFNRFSLLSWDPGKWQHDRGGQTVGKCNYSRAVCPNPTIEIERGQIQSLIFE